jgi:hypothetical protein
MSDQIDAQDLKLKSHLGMETGCTLPDDYFKILEASVWLQIHQTPVASLEIPIADHGFQVPEGYMENSADMILTKIQHDPEDPKLPVWSRQTGYITPHNYFEKTSNPSTYIHPSRFASIHKYISIAAMLLLAIGISWWVHEHGKNDPMANISADKEMDQLQNEDLIPALYETEVDEEIYTYAALSETNNPIQKNPSDTLNQPIEDFLIEHIDELDDI